MADRSSGRHRGVRPADGEREQLPVGSVPGRRTPTFTLETTPPALLADHQTTVWARLEVEAGHVVFTEDEPPWERTVAADESVVIVPGRLHRVAPSTDARFAVQFFDAP